MDISNATMLVTGANRGLGRHLVEELRSRRASVYAAARNPEQIDLADVQPVELDITSPASVAAAAELTSDVTVLINNAGVMLQTDLFSGELEQIRAEMETNFYGTLSMIRAFAPIIAANGGGAILNILSVLSWISFPAWGGYSAAKSAAWSLTNGIRQQLAKDKIVVASLHVGVMDTDMTRGIDVPVPKTDPAEVARIAVDGIAEGAYEIMADDFALRVKENLSGGVAALYPQLTAASLPRHH